MRQIAPYQFRLATDTVAVKNLPTKNKINNDCNAEKIPYTNDYLSYIGDQSIVFGGCIKTEPIGNRCKCI